MTYVELKTPSSVNSREVKAKITRLIKSGCKTNEIAWQLDGVTTDKIAHEITAIFHVLKNKIAFEVRG